jgi:peptidoglycan-associated lipoprotein
MKKLLIVFLSVLFVFSCSKKSTTEGKHSSSDLAKYGAAGSDVGKAGPLRSVNFRFDKSSLTSRAKEILKKNAKWLKSNNKIKIQVEGHCDSRGTIEYNLSLGARRANTVKKYLSDLGVKTSQIITISYGEERPLDARENEIAWAKNRRANFVIIK